MLLSANINLFRVTHYTFSLLSFLQASWPRQEMIVSLCLSDAFFFRVRESKRNLSYYCEQSLISLVGRICCQDSSQKKINRFYPVSTETNELSVKGHSQCLDCPACQLSVY